MEAMNRDIIKRRAFSECVCVCVCSVKNKNLANNFPLPSAPWTIAFWVFGRSLCFARNFLHDAGWLMRL